MKALFWILFVVALNVSFGIYSLSRYFEFVATGDTVRAMLSALLAVINLAVGTWVFAEFVSIVKKVMKDRNNGRD